MKKRDVIKWVLVRVRSKKKYEYEYEYENGTCTGSTRTRTGAHTLKNHRTANAIFLNNIMRGASLLVLVVYVRTVQ